MKLYNNAFLVTITILSFSGALSITPEECEKMPAFFEKETNKYQKLEEEKMSYGWFGIFTQKARIKNIKDQQRDIYFILLHKLADSCGMCSDEIYAEMDALFAKIDDKDKKTHR